jgi:hypothetical protein
LRASPDYSARFVVTKQRQLPKFIYEKSYCSRGEIENRIKELHHGMEIDRTSCPRFWANQFRALLSATDYASCRNSAGMPNKPPPKPLALSKTTTSSRLANQSPEKPSPPASTASPPPQKTPALARCSPFMNNAG